MQPGLSNRLPDSAGKMRFMIKKTSTSIGWIGALLMATLPAISLATAPDIAGTRWQLIAIQSMDDAQGTTRIHDPSQYTLEFGRDGTVAFRLDCNRGTASYLLKPSADRTNGSIQFGPIAATHAMCPPPHLGTLEIVRFAIASRRPALISPQVRSDRGTQQHADQAGRVRLPP